MIEKAREDYTIEHAKIVLAHSPHKFDKKPIDPRSNLKPDRYEMETLYDDTERENDRKNLLEPKIVIDEPNEIEMKEKKSEQSVKKDDRSAKKKDESANQSFQSNASPDSQKQDGGLAPALTELLHVPVEESGNVEDGTEDARSNPYRDLVVFLAIKFDEVNRKLADHNKQLMEQHKLIANVQDDVLDVKAKQQTKYEFVFDD